ncbi:MAG: ATPase, T2SS/T4P/T4SS family [Candidatus Omnitrophota bacterium]
MPLKDSKRTIGQILLSEKIITPEQLEIALEEQRKTGDYLCQAIVKLGYADEKQIFPTLANQLGIPYIYIKNITIDPEVIKKVPVKFVSHYKLMPISFSQDKLTIAMSDPLDVHTIDDLRLFLGLEVIPILAGDNDIIEAIRKYYGIGADTVDNIVRETHSMEKKPISTKADVEDLEAMAEDASIVKFVNQLLIQALEDRATDIHIEPFEDALRVRFRIDGVLYPINIPANLRFLHTSIVSRVKIMSNLDIAERRLPHDGRIKVKVGEHQLDLRVSIIPSNFGEAVHIRILSPESFLELEKLGLSENDLRIIGQVIKKSHGIIFVTGPTGSGKTTTLYAGLSKINRSPSKIITIEDPIEYQLTGVVQLQVQPKIGFGFAEGLRSMLRHDPDIMMVGEVRDFDTAEIAIRAALTGHLVFSTLHTNDAAGAVTRLLDMGVEPFLVSSSLECLIAQRLVRVICPKCKITQKLSKKMLADLGFLIEEDEVTLYKGEGCLECRKTGFRGRTGIYEILIVSEPIRELILNRASSQQIKKRAIDLGMLTLRQDGWQKALAGITTLDEVIRVTQQEELPT